MAINNPSGSAPPLAPEAPPENVEVPAGADDSFTYIKELLAFYGLESLADWAWDQIVAGSSAEQILQALRQRPEHAARFPGMAIRRQHNLPAVSEGEYISYERQAYQLMRGAGMPVGFFDSPEDFAALIGRDISVNELNQRITGAYVRVAQAPAEVRAAFEEFFGADGDVALAAFILDPDRAQPFLDRAVTEAEISGTGARFGVGVSHDLATRLAEIGVDQGQAQQGFGQVAELAGFFRETVSEAEDLTVEDTGVGAVFGTDADAAAALRRRRGERQAQFGGRSGSGRTQQGATGLGSAGDY